MTAPVLLGVSLKMYFGHHETLNWSRKIVQLADQHPAVTSGAARLFVLPAFPAIVPVAGILARSGVDVGAQDIATEDVGAYTGEVSGPYLKEIGCRYAEVGHAERRRLYGEGDTVVAAKTAAALRNGLTPVLCVGELDPVEPEEAARRTRRGRAPAVRHARQGRPRVRTPVGHRRARARLRRAHHHGVRGAGGGLNSRSQHAGSTVIYGGSAGPGLLSRLGGSVGGLFLGRFAHDPAAVGRILDEIEAPASPVAVA